MRLLWITALLYALTAGFAPEPAWAADEQCYDNFIGKVFKIKLAEESCLKNKKWNCQQFCYTYAGMTSATDFSIVIPRNQGGMNIFVPFAPGGKSEFTVRGYSWRIVSVTPDLLELEYLGEREEESAKASLQTDG